MPHNYTSSAEESARAGSPDVATVIQEIRTRCPGDKRVVFVSGNFNIVHPGHLRLLNFAKDCGDFLVVGVNQDGLPDALLPEHLRLEGVRSVSVVDYTFVLRVPPEEFILALQPTVVVKGKEHEFHENPEWTAVDQYGGKLLFSSGDVRFSSLDLLQRELIETNFSTIRKPKDFLDRHEFNVRDLVGVIERFRELRVVVVGDLVVDEYINCDPLGMSREDPTIVVTPIRSDRFVGGAGIVAAHARGLGAEVCCFSVSGNDEAAQFAERTLQNYGVYNIFLPDDSRPTTLKQRYAAGGKTLLRVSHLRQHDITQDLAESMFEGMRRALDDANLVIFADFNYGCLPPYLVDELTRYCGEREIIMVADSQSSSQIGDVSRFKHMRLLTPTEREARLAVRDFKSGLVVLAEALRQEANAEHILITLGVEGLLIHARDREHDRMLTDRLSAFNTAPKDVSGAGDSLLACAAMALAVKADIWQAAYLGSIAAACQVSRVGNSPLTATDLVTELLS